MNEGYGEEWREEERLLMEGMRGKVLMERDTGKDGREEGKEGVDEKEEGMRRGDRTALEASSEERGKMCLSCLPFFCPFLPYLLNFACLFYPRVNLIFPTFLLLPFISLFNFSLFSFLRLYCFSFPSYFFLFQRFFLLLRFYSNTYYSR